MIYYAGVCGMHDEFEQEVEYGMRDTGYDTWDMKHNMQPLNFNGGIRIEKQQIAIVS